MKLWYFDIFGIGEPIRMLLKKKGVEFTDMRLNGDEMMKLK